MFANPCTTTTVQSLTRLDSVGEQWKIFLLTLAPPVFEGSSWENSAWSRWKPGQFLMLRPDSWGQELLWGRPFSIYEASRDKGITVLFAVAGRGTAKLAGLKKEDPVTLWGPLGNPFAAVPVDAQQKTLILAGGIGIAPFVEYVRQHPRPETIQLDFGHRAPCSVYPFWQPLSELCRCQGHEETCQEDLQAFIAHIHNRVAHYAEDMIIACGPLPFLQTVKQAADAQGTRAQLSLESRMACGVGACLGCVVRHTGGPVSVCARGPMFWSDEIEL